MTATAAARSLVAKATIIIRRPALPHPHARDHHRQGATTIARPHHPIAAMHLDHRGTTLSPVQEASCRINPLATGMPPTTAKSMVMEIVVPS